MKTKKHRRFNGIKIAFLTALLLAFSLFGALNAQTTKAFKLNGDTLMVYSGVPGLASEFISQKYKIEVKSAATNNVWVECLTHNTFNKANILPDIPDYDDQIRATVIQGYQKYTRGWSHAFANIEMSNNAPIDVRITLINGFKVQGNDISKIALHPAQKAFRPSYSGNQIFFTIYNPCQIFVDINGQMDDYNKAIDQSTADQDNPATAYTPHVVSLFANPVMANPASSGDARTLYVSPSSNSADYTSLRNNNLVSYDIVYFMPGAHNLGVNYKVKANKKYFIPGDAVVFGTFNNLNDISGVGDPTPAPNARIYGYGIISGANITHPQWCLTWDQVENDDLDKHYKGISIHESDNVEVYGISLIDPPMHSINIEAATNGAKLTAVRWAKAISWRANGDGIGSTTILEDCFIRTGDDGTYVKGDKRRCTFWKDTQAAIFNMAGTEEDFPITIEDCDVLYYRSRGATSYGVFNLRADGDPGEFIVDVTVKNLILHDKRANIPVFNIYSQEGTNKGSSYKGYKFENVVIKYNSVNNIKEVLTGYSGAKWTSMNFKNATMAGSPLALSNFTTNSYVSGISFTTATHTITVAVNGSGGNVSGAGTGIANLASRTVTATPAGGYKFLFWTENNRVVADTAVYTFNIAKTRSLVAHFAISDGTLQYTIITSSNPTVGGTVTGGGTFNSGTSVQVCANANANYTFSHWTIDGVTVAALACTTFTVTKNTTMIANFTANPINCVLPWNTSDFTIDLNTPTYSSGPIDISCVSSVKLHMDLSETAFFESADKLTVYYKIDGVQHLIVEKINDFVSYPVDVTGISGNTLEILITSVTDDAAEIYSIKNVSVIEEGTITKLDQTIIFPAIAAKTFGDADFILGATASSGLAVTYSSSNTAVATIVNGNIHIVGVGTTNITASQAGNATYNVAPSVIQTLTVNKANQTITFPAVADKMVGDADFIPGATASSGLAVTYTSSNTAVATIVNGNIHIVGEGTTNITASHAGNTNYNAAPSVVQPFTVIPSQPSPDVTAISNWILGNTNVKAAGSNRMMVVMVMGESTATFSASSATYGGQAMTRVTDKAITNGSITYSAIFILNETGVNLATSGTINVVWSATPSAGSSIYSVMLANVDQTTTIVKSYNGLATATTISTIASLAAASGDMVVMCGATANNSTITFNNDFIKKNESNSGWGDGVTGYKMGAGVNETPSFTQSASGRMVITAIVAKKATVLKSGSIVTDIANANENVIRVYPNPVSHILNIDFSGAELSKEVKVFNSVGQLVHRLQTKNESTQINVQSLNLKGVVVVQVITGNSVSNHRILIK